MPNKIELKKLINENNLAEKVDQEKVMEIYTSIIQSINKIAKQLSDDDAYALHEKLKNFFNKTF